MNVASYHEAKSSMKSNSYQQRNSSQSKILLNVRSINGVRIGLTEKQWKHIIAARPLFERFQRQIMEAVEKPDEVYSPPPRVKPQVHAIKRFDQLIESGLSGNLVVVYRNSSPDEGFIITAFPVSDRRKERRYATWRRLYP